MVEESNQYNRPCLFFSSDSKSLGFLSMGALHLFHGVLISPQCLGILRIGCVAFHEHFLDAVQRFFVPHLGRYHHGKFVVLFHIFNNTNIVPTIRIPFHCSLLPMVADAPWFVFVNALNMCSQVMNVRPTIQVWQPPSTIRLPGGHSLSIHAVRSNTYHQDSITRRLRPCRCAPKPSRGRMRRLSCVSSCKTGSCSSLFLQQPKCSRCTPSSCSRHSYLHDHPWAIR